MEVLGLERRWFFKVFLSFFAKQLFVLVVSFFSFPVAF